MSLPKCPKCGAEGDIGDCTYKDVGGVETYDEFTFVCKACGHKEQKGSYGGSITGGTQTPDALCPFCDESYREHRS